MPSFRTVQQNDTHSFVRIATSQDGLSGNPMVATPCLILAVWGHSIASGSGEVKLHNGDNLSADWITFRAPADRPFNTDFRPQGIEYDAGWTVTTVLTPRWVIMYIGDAAA